jgi:putative MATE family efflux protein
LDSEIDQPKLGAPLFTRRALVRLIIPLVIEQTLGLLVGMVDAMMVSVASESAMAGVSLTDTIAILLINLFSAFASGGAILVGQFIGAHDDKNASRAASQLVNVSFLISFGIMAACLLLNRQILSAVYGKIDADVMYSASSYFYITTLSYPFVALFNSSAALFRATGNSRTPMLNSIIMNVLNIVGNAFFIYVMHWGAFGAGLSTTISRAAAAITMLLMLRNPALAVAVRSYRFWRLDGSMIRRILRFGIPNSLENSLFQIGKIALAGLVSTLGTAAIAANSVINNVGGFAVLPGQAIGAAVITVTAQCIGAGEYEQVRRYFKQLMKITFGAMVVFTVAIYAAAPLIFRLYNLSEATYALCIKIMLLHSFGTGLFWTTAFVPANALRAAGDVLYPMVIAIVSMMLWRVGIGYLLVYTTDLGIYGVYVGILVDWAFRSATYMHRYIKGKWRTGSLKSRA